ncbi:hypothetical protein AB0L57_04025 [Nocardia sp. NPDC052254]|uniref:hypothetical protein n=1 Tax=Nocardia sp. NPDC052254 TaxID=3155681 RepID=UPI00344603CC
MNVLFGSTFISTSTGGVACELARGIHDDVLSRSGKIWPADPDGGDKPLQPTADGWRGQGGVIPFGQVEQAKDPDPNLDGVVRWWLPDTHDGLIAKQSGDP